ncbi:hypothetical protein ACRS6B_24740 [Nocardia asteroides]
MPHATYRQRRVLNRQERWAPCRSRPEPALPSSATDHPRPPEPTTGHKPDTWWHRPKRIALMVYSAFNRKPAATDAEPSTAPEVPTEPAAVAGGPARWWRTRLRAPRAADTSGNARVHAVAPVRAARERRVIRSSRGVHAALWQRALFLAPDVAAAGTHPALRQQIDAEGTA